MPALISICIPTFREEKYIVETLTRLAEQTAFFQSEIVIADYDPDKTKSTYKAIFEAFKTDTRFYNKIKFVQVFKDGIGFARHVATMAANGKYIVTMDADSRFAMKDDIVRIIGALDAGNHAMVHCNNLIKPEEMTNEHAAQANQMYVWRNDILNPYIPILCYEPGMTFTSASYHATTGWPDVVVGEGPILGWKYAIQFGLERTLHLSSVAVYVSSRRALGSKGGVILDMNYHHAYR